MDYSLNARIYNDLKSKIETGIYKEDDLLPTEMNLQNEYGVSRAPVRQALGRLEHEGLIVRKSGKGTYVANRLLWQLAGLGGFRSEFLKKSNRVICKVVDAKKLLPGKTVRDILEMQDGEEVTYIARLRILNNQPYQYLEHYIKGLDIEKVRAVETIEDMPLFLAQNGFYLKTVREEIEAVSATKSIAEKLEIAPEAPILKIKRGAYDITNKMYEYMIYYTATKNWKYRVQYIKN